MGKSERNRQRLEVEALDKKNFRLVIAEYAPLCFLIKVYITSLLEAHPDLSYLLPLNYIINTFQALIKIKITNNAAELKRKESTVTNYMFFLKSRSNRVNKDGNS